MGNVCGEEVIRLAFVAIVAFGFGVVLMDTLQEKPKPQSHPVAQQAVLGMPIICDAVVCQNGQICKCYVRK